MKKIFPREPNPNPLQSLLGTGGCPVRFVNAQHPLAMNRSDSIVIFIPAVVYCIVRIISPWAILLTSVLNRGVGL